MNKDIIITWEDPRSLKLHPDNPNTHPDEQIEVLIKILKYQGFREAVRVSNNTGFVTVGNGRVIAAIKMGLNKIPVSYQDYDDWDQEYADIVADNAISEWSTLNMASINAQIENLGPMDIDLLGLKGFEIEPMDKPTSPNKDSSKAKECPNCGEQL